MKSKIFYVVVFAMTISISHIYGQNNNTMFGLGFGVGNSGFLADESPENNVRNIYYLTANFHFQKRISEKWAINFLPNVGLSGHKTELESSANSATSAKSITYLLNVAVHPKYFIKKNLYVSVGPEYSHVLRNIGQTYNKEDVFSIVNETKYFNRNNLLISSAIGCSFKVDQTVKRSPIQFDVLWYFEFRFKRGLTNMLKKNELFNDVGSKLLAFELVTGVSFSSKK
ncbi:MAG TPA: hypothetical protein PKD16_11335 [Saprospiraceae bacterium]|jgi:hypothetical protein|nr:hypothetical protein [Saprospiraceae bacterium]HMT70748.1 hypothetical protein [Saprospiraceae bacterium]